MLFRHPHPRRTRRPSGSSESDLDLSDGEDIPDSVVGPIEIPKSPSHQAPSRIGSTPGMRAPSHIDFSSSPYTPRSLQPAGSVAAGHLPGLQRQNTGGGWPQQLYRQWFGAIIDGRSIQVHSILADHPNIMDMRRKEPTPFHMALTEVASQSLGIDTSSMDGLQVAIMGYKNAYAHWRLGNGSQAEQKAGMSTDQMKEHVAVREVILGALIDAISPSQLDSHFFGRQKNTTLHLAAFYNDANLVERLLRQGAAVDIPNSMGFLPSGISTDEQTQQWLAAYRGQVRGLRYDAEPEPEFMHAQHHTPDSDYAADGFGDLYTHENAATGSPMAVPGGSGARRVAEELELGVLEHFSDDDEVSESSYVRQFADSARSPASTGANAPPLEDEHDSASDEDVDEPPPNASVASTSDRSSLGLGGSGLAKRSLEGSGLRKRLLDGGRRRDADDGRPRSRGSEASAYSDTPPNTANSLSNAPSIGSYYTADGLLSDGPDSPLPPLAADSGQEADRDADASLRIKNYSESMNEITVDDIFSDTDDHIMQTEPSFYRSGAGLADPNRSPDSTQKRPSPLSLAGAASRQPPDKSAGRVAISAFPVVVADVAPQIVDDTGKLMHLTDGSKTELLAKDRQRAASPFMMRDSLYEMIMGRSVSRLSMASIGSAYSNALSNTSTLGASKEQQQQPHGTGQPQSPTSPTSHTSHISPTSTSFDGSTGSPAQTVISSPTNETGFGTIAKSTVRASEAVPEEPSTSEPRPDLLGYQLRVDSDAAGSSDESDAADDASEGFDGRSPSPVPAPRPTAASLFEVPDADPEPMAAPPFALSDADPEPMTQVNSGNTEDAYEEPLALDHLSKIGRIGRRQGRAAVEMLRDEPESGMDPDADFGGSSDASGLSDKDFAAPAPFEFEALPSDAPMTREKCDQYLQTLISRNTMRSGSPSKRSAHTAMLQALRAASPAPAPTGGDAFELGEYDGASDFVPSMRGASIRHASKRSEGSIDFLTSRSPSSLGMRERGWGPESAVRPPSSLLTREALSASGRTRSKTVTAPPTPPKAAPQTRKVSPSLVTLKTRNLVSNSPAKLPSPISRESPFGLSPSRAHLSDSRSRAMTAPADAQPPPVLALQTVAASARIGRVAALSQTFERQQAVPSADASTPRVLATARSEVVDAGSKKPVPQRPVARSNSVSSSHSAGGHGQLTVASGTHEGGESSRPPPHSSSEGNSAPPPPADDDAGNRGGGDDAGGSGAGGSGNAGGAGDSSGGGGDKPGRDPRAVLLEPIGSESNGSTSSHTSSADTGRGLAASAASGTALIDSHGSGDMVGSSIFASTDSRDSSDREALNTAEPSRLHAPVAARKEPGGDVERRQRFKELASRRKSGTLERISNSGVVKNRKALFATSDSSMRSVSPSSSRSSVSSTRPRRARAPPTDSHASGVSDEAGPSTNSRTPVSVESRTPHAPRRASPAFLALQGEEHGSRDSAASDVAAPSSPPPGDGKDLERPFQAGNSAPHPVEQLGSADEVPPLNRGGSTNDGIDTDAALERLLAQAREAAAHVSVEPPPAGPSARAPSSRGGSDRSKSSAGSSDDSFHLLSSLDTNSTPSSTPMDSTRDNTNVGLLAQYNMDSGRVNRRVERMSRDVGYNYLAAGGGLPAGDSSNDVELGFTTLGDDQHAASGAVDSQGRGDDALPVAEDQLGEEFQTMMPLRPRTNPKAVFGLSTVVEEDEGSKNSSMALSDLPRTPAASVHTKPSEQFLQAASAAEAASSSAFSTLGLAAASEPLRGLRSALGPHLTVAPIYRGLGSVTFPEAMDTSPVSPAGGGVAQETLDLASTGVEPAGSYAEPDDDSHSGSPSLGSHSFDPSLVFGYTSEDSSTMASRSSLERSDMLHLGGPGSSASRVIYLQPLGSTEFEGSTDGHTADGEGQPQPLKQQKFQHFFQQMQSPVASSSRPAVRWQQSSSPLSSSSSAVYSGKGKQPARAMPEMQEIQAPDSLPHMPATTIDQLEADASTDEEPIPAILFLPSQDFEGYRPIGYQIRDYHDELRQEKREMKGTSKWGVVAPQTKSKVAMSSASSSHSSIADPLPRRLTRQAPSHRAKRAPSGASKSGYTTHPDLKRVLEASTISARRLRAELDATIADDDDDAAGPPPPENGTIKPLTKRARTVSISDLFAPPEAESGEKRASFLDSVEIPVSELGGGSETDSDDDAASDDDRERRAREMMHTQEFDDRARQQPEYDPAVVFGPRRRLVLRSQARNFSERVMDEINGLDVRVRDDVHGTVNVRSAGQFSYGPPAGTVRPSTIPDYVSPLNGVPAGPFFMPPKAAVKSGYLYMRILSVEDMEGDPSSIYFVIRNGIDTLATTPVTIDGINGTTINQEFRILTDPSVSITMWMRFRSDAIIHRGFRGARGMLSEPGCVPPLLRRLVRRNTRSRGGRWQCQGAADSVFDFDEGQPRYAPGARRAGPAGRGANGHVDKQQAYGGGYPERSSSAMVGHSIGAYGVGTQQSHGAHNDPRSLNATQAPSSVFYEPGAETAAPSSSNKGLAQAQFREETRGVAVVHVGEMIEEVFLRGLVDSWDVENVWESRCGAQMNLQLFFIPECPLFREEELPKTLSECEMAMEVCAFHNRTLNSGYMSQRGGDTRFWRRRYFRLIGGFLFAYHEESKEPRCFIDLNDATRVVDAQPDRGQRAAGMGAQFGSRDLMRSQRMRRRGAHQRNSSDVSLRRRDAAAPAPAHGYASDSEPADGVDIADPGLQRATLRRPRGQEMNSHADSGIVSGGSTDGAPDNGMQHSFAIEFGAGGLIEFYTETEKQKRLWVEIIKRVVGRIPKIPSWLIKLLHADVSERIDGAGQLPSDSSLGNGSIPSSKFEELTHPHPHLRA